MTEVDTHQTRIIVLEDGQHLTTTVRKLFKGWTVRFVRGTSLLGKEVFVKTTITGRKALKWSEGTDHLNVHCAVECLFAGSFRYWFTTDENDDDLNPSGSGYLLVLPSLHINKKSIPLDAISCQTHLAKLLGPLCEWESRLRVAYESGYNMIHLTPIHKLGISNSGYSIADHHRLMDTIKNNSVDVTFSDIERLVRKMEVEWGILTVQDVVWNHAAKNAQWLMKHPECGYNCVNSPHLRPAYVIDRVYHYFGKEVAEGKWENRGVPPVVDSVHHTNTIEYILRTEVLPKIQLHEFLQCDIDALCDEFRKHCKAASGPSPIVIDDLTLDIDPLWRRFGRKVNMKKALEIYNNERSEASDEEERIELCVSEFRAKLEKLNCLAGEEGWRIILEGLGAVMGHIFYERVADHGPKKGLVSDNCPLTTDYFLHLEPDVNWEEDEKLAYNPEKGRYLLAFNGWVMASGLDNFALPSSQVYLRRQLVCWGDSIKLNYGEKPQDCPYLWRYMKTYTQQCAKIFHGLRIDNAHGTPIHVAEYLLRSAREIRSDIYVFAELFTGSEDLDNMFVNRLGISSLIREAQAAHDSHEQGRLVYKYGGDCLGAFTQKNTRRAESSIAHALFLDQSHDNPTPIESRTVFDVLPTAAMVSMASCATGSTRGYDELIPHAIHVVHEDRTYPQWNVDVHEKSGILQARKILNRLHQQLALDGYSEVFVDQMDPDVVAITRHNPINHSTVIVISHTAFNKNAINRGRVFLKHFPVGGVMQDVLFEMKLDEVLDDQEKCNGCNGTLRSSNNLEMLKNYRVEIRENVPIDEAKMITLHGGSSGFVEVTNLSSGSVVGICIRLSEENQKAVNDARKLVLGQDTKFEKELEYATETLTLVDMNHVLFCCEGEDQVNIGQGAYDVPNFGKFVYCGLNGLVPVLEQIQAKNDLGHPLCSNLRDGMWLPEFIIARLRKYKGLQQVAAVFEKALTLLIDVPYYLRPCYFEAIFSHLYRKFRAVAMNKMNRSFVSSSSLVRSLALSTISFVSVVSDAKLAPISEKELLPGCETPSLAAGLPHFATGIWRNWGRDTFIALPGCLLFTGRFEEAKNIILSFAGSMRHGLIPNLLAEGKSSRYNCRDAVWFWLYSIIRYTKMAPNGIDILQSTVRRIYPNDESVYGEEFEEQSLLKTMLEALNRHFAGISYRERNAGSQIDEHMTSEGFNVNVWVDRNTGFIHGGNRWNCGTWMDKMGSSAKAGNKGEPATPRDGAAVELQALASSTLAAFAEWHSSGLIESPGVEHEGTRWSWSEWSSKIRKSFEAEFFVDESNTDQYVNKRNIVKDTVGSTLGYTDYQLRCNFPIALAVDPLVLDPIKAWAALEMAKNHLVGPLGMKTLDPSDWNYAGFYNNDDQGNDKKTAHGWNYHQGPEWLWVAGFYLQARLVIGKKLGGEYLKNAIREVQAKMGSYYKHIQESPWRSLPELTQEDGIPCPASCPAQAWSVGCLLEVSRILEHLK